MNHVCKAFGCDNHRETTKDFCNTCRNQLVPQAPQEDLKARVTDPLQIQIGGGHYKELVIQPIEYIHANGIPFAEGSVIKYVTRWRAKGGIKDLEKAKHFLELLIALESKDKP